MEKILAPLLKILAPLFEKTPVALVIIGLFFILIGAAGGTERLSLVIDSTPWRIVIAGMGAVVASFAALLIWRESNSEEAPVVRAEKYGLRITAPKSGDTVDSPVRLEGTFEQKPPDDSVVIIETAFGDNYFQHAPHFCVRTSKWSGEYGIQSGQRELEIAILGKSAKALRDYYNLVGTRTNWQGIKGRPPDIAVCDRIKVIRK